MLNCTVLVMHHIPVVAPNTQGCEDTQLLGNAGYYPERAQHMQSQHSLVRLLPVEYHTPSMELCDNNPTPDQLMVLAPPHSVDVPDGMLGDLLCLVEHTLGLAKHQCRLGTHNLRLPAILLLLLLYFASCPCLSNDP